MSNRAKTSARSKGYRKVEQKKPFLTKKEIIWLVSIVLAIVLAIVLFNVLYDDGSLKIADGKPVAENIDDSILIDAGNTDAHKYYKLGEVGQLEGYRREKVQNSTNENLGTYRFYPEDEADKLEYIYIGGGKGTPTALVSNEYTSNSLSGFVPGQIEEVEIDGRKIYCLTTTYYQTDEETGVTTFVQAFAAYMQSAFEEYSVSVRQNVIAESEPNLDEAGIEAFGQSVSLTQEELMANLEKAVSVISTEAKR